MFIEIKPNEMVNVTEIAAFYMFPETQNEYSKRTIFIRMKGSDDNLRFTYDTMRECNSAYRKIINALKRCNIIVEEDEE